MVCNTPMVSVVIPAFNAQAYISTAVDSVLAQTLRDFELIVVDDGSSDGTGSVVQAYGGALRCLRQANGGVSRARNHGVAESRGRYVAFLDADDAWQPSKLARQVEALERHGAHGACYTAVTIVDEGMAAIGEQRSGADLITRENLLVYGNLVLGGGSSLACTRDLLLATGGFDEALSLCADWEMWIRLANHTRFLYVDEPLVAYRALPGSMSRNPALLERDTLALLSKTLSPVIPSDAPLRARAYSRQYRVLGGSYLQAGARRDALRCFLLSIRHDPRRALHGLALPSRALRWRLRGPAPAKWPGSS